MNDSILVVEDDPTLARTIAHNLSARGYPTRSAMTVAAATVAIAADRPAVILLDIDLPDGSGWEVVRRLCQADRDDVAVIVMSALQPNPRLCHQFHAAGVLEKPFPMGSLLRLVAQATGQLAAPDPADIMSADEALDGKGTHRMMPLMVAIWFIANAALALGVAVACDKMFGTFSTGPRFAPVETIERTPPVGSGAAREEGGNECLT